MSKFLGYMAGTRRTIELCERDLDQLAAQARIAGDTWQEIGAAIGMSKQAAQKRYGTPRERAELRGQTTIHDALE